MFVRAFKIENSPNRDLYYIIVIETIVTRANLDRTQTLWTLSLGYEMNIMYIAYTQVWVRCLKNYMLLHRYCL